MFIVGYLIIAVSIILLTLYLGFKKPKIFSILVTIPVGILLIWSVSTLFIEFIKHHQLIGIHILYGSILIGVVTIYLALKKPKVCSILVSTLITLMLGMLATIPDIPSQASKDALMVDTAMIGMGQILQALQMYKVHNKAYPTEQQGLDALIHNPGNLKSWRGPYIEGAKLKDPWKKPFRYSINKDKIKLYSNGPDKTAETKDDIVYPEED